MYAKTLLTRGCYNYSWNINHISFLCPPLSHDIVLSFSRCCRLLSLWHNLLSISQTTPPLLISTTSSALGAHKSHFSRNDLPHLILLFSAHQLSAFTAAQLLFEERTGSRSVPVAATGIDQMVPLEIKFVKSVHLG